MTHPAIAHRWAVVPFTRGKGVEVRGGPVVDLIPPLFPHFQLATDWDEFKPGTLDFVFLVGDAGVTNFECWLINLKAGGYALYTDDGGGLTIVQAGEGEPHDRAYFDVAQDFPHPCACVVRYGGFGDSIQAANILPELKRQGYFVVFMTLPRGKNILAHDPHIDAWLLQDDDQVANQELTSYWEHWAPKFDKFVQLSESVEGTLLAYPGRANHAWPDEVRRKYMGRNYLEWTSELAQLPYTSDARFYETPEENAESHRIITALRAKASGRATLVMGEQLAPAFVVMWALAGSSHHKFYPHQDDVIANALAAWPEALFILAGDDACRVLEAGWEDHPRILCASGELSIRQTLALAKAVDCVVGPETGVLNAVAFEPMGKVITLSHSSEENLSKHWVNTITLTPHDTPCYPCHRMQLGREFCHEHEPTGAAMCQWNIPGPEFMQALAMHYNDWRRLHAIFTPAEEVAA